jgi:hypothetical protein
MGRNQQRGPTVLEVTLGAALSVALGVVLGAAYMVLKPVELVPSIPKDPPAGALYYIEGVHGFNKTGGLEDKRKAFLAGQSVEVDEGEINLLLGFTPKPAPPPPPKPGDKPAPAPDAKMLVIGSLNARVRDGKIQFGTAVDFNILTVMGTVFVRAEGTFEKQGTEFVFEPETVYLGGCPVTHIPFAKEWVMSKFLFARPVPADIAGAWAKLSDVTIDGSTLRLKMP